MIRQLKDNFCIVEEIRIHYIVLVGFYQDGLNSMGDQGETFIP